MALFSQKWTSGTEDTDPLSEVGTEDTDSPAAGTFLDEEAEVQNVSPLDSFVRKEYESARAAYSDSTASVLDQIKKARELLLAQPTSQTRAEYVQGLAQKLSAPKSPDDPRFFERRNLHTFLRDVGQYGAEQRQTEREAKLKQQQDLQKIDELAARYGEETGYKRLQLASQLMGRARSGATGASPAAERDTRTTDQKNADAMGLSLKDYLEYKRGLADRGENPNSVLAQIQRAQRVLSDPNSSEADKKAAQVFIDSKTPPDVRKMTAGQETKSLSYLERIKSQKLFTVPDLQTAIDQVDAGGWFAAGNFSKWLEGKPLVGQAATDLERTLDSVRSKLGFDKLEELKKLSPYGASGLGAVSNAEQKLLQAVKGSLERDQSPKNLRKNLLRIKEFYEEQVPSMLEVAGISDIDEAMGKIGQAPAGQPPKQKRTIKLPSGRTVEVED